MHSEIEISTAIEKAKPGIRKYLDIMTQFGEAEKDVAADKQFQRAYNGFYRVRQRPEPWYGQYYGLMQEYKRQNAKPGFADVLHALYQRTGRYEPSFSSKMVATLDPDKPIWDQYVLANTGRKSPAYTSKTKIEDAQGCYASIEQWYDGFIGSEEGVAWIARFDEMIPERGTITPLKKIDFILWQIRGE